MKKKDKERLKKAITDLFKAGETLYYGDIATRLNLDLGIVVSICNELEESGVIRIFKE